jgi:hypothetical protein
VQLRLERCVGFRDFVRALQLKQRHHQRFRDVASPIRTEAAGRGGRRLKYGAHG